MKGILKNAKPAVRLAMQLGLVGAGGGALLAADQFGLIDGLLGGGDAPIQADELVGAVVAAVDESGLAMRAGGFVVGGLHDGAEWVVHRVTDAALLPLKGLAWVFD